MADSFGYFITCRDRIVIVLGVRGHVKGWRGYLFIQVIVFVRGYFLFVVEKFSSES